jgi:predicted N-acetyltransferase YhbS
MIFLDTEKLFDIPARETLLDRAFGPNRLAKTAERLREGRIPADGLAFVARCGDRLVASLRFWHVDAGGIPALMLGPIAVDKAFRSEGLGGRMIRHGLARAAEIGHNGVVLVGDAPYYSRFGFDRGVTRRLELPGPVDSERFLGLELVPGSMAAAKGLVRATGAVSFAEASQLRDRRKAA